eukprot:1734863-Pleurochrysis_carterae.AAC.1
MNQHETVMLVMNIQSALKEQAQLLSIATITRFHLLDAHRMPLTVFGGGASMCNLAQNAAS